MENPKDMFTEEFRGVKRKAEGVHVAPQAPKRIKVQMRRGRILLLRLT